MKTYIYCTKAKPYLAIDKYRDGTTLCYPSSKFDYEFICEENKVNGKVVASFDLNSIDEFTVTNDGFSVDGTNNLFFIDTKKATQLTLEELQSYISIGKKGYAYHIENLEIIEPLELSEFEKDSKKGLKGYNWSGININFVETITKAPQSWQYAYYKGERVLLMSIKSKWCEKILNGEKTIKVRKTAPREVLK